eukprot:jgi/Mesvir1/11361/Mv10261-RA.1
MRTKKTKPFGAAAGIATDSGTVPVSARPSRAENRTRQKPSRRAAEEETTADAPDPVAAETPSTRADVANDVPTAPTTRPSFVDGLVGRMRRAPAAMSRGVASASRKAAEAIATVVSAAATDKPRDFADPKTQQEVAEAALERFAIRDAKKKPKASDVRPPPPPPRADESVKAYPWLVDNLVDRMQSAWTPHERRTPVTWPQLGAAPSAPVPPPPTTAPPPPPPVPSPPPNPPPDNLAREMERATIASTTSGNAPAPRSNIPWTAGPSVAHVATNTFAPTAPPIAPPSVPSAPSAPSAPFQTARPTPPAPVDNSRALVLYEPRVNINAERAPRASRRVPADFPDPMTSDFQTQLRKYLDGEWPDAEPPETRQKLADPRSNSCARDPNAKKIPSPQQTSVHAFLERMARFHPSRRPARGFLAWHSTGSGKTATTMAAIDAFWDAQDPETGGSVKILLATSIENSRNNTIEKIAEWAPMFPRLKRMSRDEAVRAVKARVWGEILTFAKLAHAVDVHNSRKNADPKLLHNAVLIMDEVQNLFHPLEMQKKDNAAILSLLATRRAPVHNPAVDVSGLYTVILSATPGDNVDEILTLVNMIRHPSSHKIAFDSHAEDFRGLVSFADFTGDLSAYPELMPAEDHLTPMSAEQEKAFREQVHKSHLRHDPESLDQYYTTLQGTSNNMSFHQYEGESLLRNLSRLSPKFSAIVGKLTPGEKHFVYSRFSRQHGIGDLEKVLKAMGYARLEDDRAERSERRYIVLGTNEASDRQGLKDVAGVFNHPSNRTGQRVHLILASGRYNEGLDLKGVRHVHIVEPQPTKNKEKQLIARAVRYCSHDQLDKDARTWTVSVHRYMSRPSAETIRLHKALDAIERDHPGRLRRAEEEAMARSQNAAEDLRDRRVTGDLRKALTLYKKVADAEIELLRERSEIWWVDGLVSDRARDNASDRRMDTLLTTLREVAVDCKYMLPVHNDRNLRTASGRRPLTCRYSGAHDNASSMLDDRYEIREISHAGGARVHEEADGDQVVGRAQMRERDRERERVATLSYRTLRVLALWGHVAKRVCR